MASGKTLRTKLECIANSNLTGISIASGQSTYICALTLTPGTWLLIGEGYFTAGFTETCSFSINGAGTAINEQSTGLNGGDTTICGVRTVTDNTTIRLATYQSSGTAKTAKGQLHAIRIG